MQTPKISIIVPIYNAEKYIDRCMQSIYAQTLTDYEIILVNDGSKDNSLACCQAYADKDDRIRVIDKENGGAGSARNAGIEIAKGEYLAFPDADDWFEKEMYQELYDLAKSEDFDIVFSGVHYYQQGDGGEMVYSRSSYCTPVRYVTQKECRENVMKLFPTTTIFDVPWNKLYKRELLIKNGIRFRNLRRCQDATFNIDCYHYAEKVAADGKAYYNYMENTQADVWRKFPKNYIDINVYYYTHLKEILTDWGMYKENIKQHYDTSFVLSVYETLGMFDNPNWGLKKREQKEYVMGIMGREDIQNFLLAADVRTDALKKWEIISTQNHKTFFKLHKKEKRKNKLRKNKLVMKVYRLLKGDYK